MLIKIVKFVVVINMDNHIQKYFEDAYFHPHYISDYYPIWYLMKNKRYDDIKKFFSILEKLDTEREEYLPYKESKINNILLGLNHTPKLYQYSKIEKHNLAEQIFRISQKTHYMLPKYVFTSFNISEFNKRFITKGEDQLNHLLKKSGVMLISHHWGAFQFAILYLLINNYPVTFLISEDILSAFTDTFDFDNYPNAKVIGLASGKSENSSEMILYNSVNDLKHGRIVFALTDNPVSPNATKETTKFMGCSVKSSRIAAGLAKFANVPIMHLTSYINEDTEIINLKFDNIITNKEINEKPQKVIIDLSNLYMEEELMKGLQHWTYADWFYKYMYVEE